MTPEQEREEIKDGLVAVLARSVALLRDAAVCAARGDTIPNDVLNGLVYNSSVENQLRVRLAVIDGTSPPVIPQITTIPLPVIQGRLEAEGKWEIYVNYMFGAAARRNAFMRILMIGHAIEASDVSTRNSILNALTSAPSSLPAAEAQEIVDRVMALQAQ